MTERLTFPTADGLVLEAERRRSTAGPARAAAVLCHPHPQYGGTMRSIVVGALFDALPTAGVDCLRFNFRGVEASEGTYSGGDAERLDVRAAVATLHADAGGDRPLLLAGWSFGADVALSVHDAAIHGWLAIAAPLRFAHDLDRLARDERPKRFVLAQHDEFRAPADVEAQVATWVRTRVDVVAGASHFFVGCTDAVVALARDAVDDLVGRG